MLQINFSPRAKAPHTIDGLRTALEGAFAAFAPTRFELDLVQLTLGWTDGPRPDAFWTAAREPQGWELQVKSPFGEFETKPNSRAIKVNRTYSPDFLAQAAVRFYAVRRSAPDLAKVDDRQRLVDLLNSTDDSSSRRFSIVQAISNELVALTSSDGLDARRYLESVSACLLNLGYDKLWAKAFDHIS